MSGSLDNSSIDLSALPAPDIFAPLDYHELLKERLDQFDGLTPLLFDETGQPHEGLIEADIIETENGLMFQIPVSDEAGMYYSEIHSDPAVKLWQVDAYLKLLINNQMNRVAQGLMPAFATGAQLDQLAIADGIVRKTIIEADPSAEPPVEAVLESDNALRRRWLLSQNQTAIGGPHSWYLSQAFNADDNVKDVKVFSPAPLEIVVVILSHEGNGTAAAELVVLVDDYIRNHAYFPQGDLLTVRSAEVVEYAIEATLVYYTGASKEIVNSEAENGFLEFKKQREKIGENVYQSPIDSLLMIDGVYRAIINAPADLPILIDENTQASYCTGLSIIDGGQHGTL